MEQILQAFGPSKEIVTTTMMLYRNTKLKVRSPDRDTNFFDIVAGILQEDTLTSYLFIICLVYVLRTLIDQIKANDFTIIKKDKKQTISCGGCMSI